LKYKKFQKALDLLDKDLDISSIVKKIRKL